MEPFQQRTGQRIANGVIYLSLVTLIGGGLFFARRNLRLGRGDRRNATRLALIVIGLTMLMSTLNTHHVLTFWEMSLFISSAGYSLFLAGLFWVLYIAIEPFVRRRWPQILVSWTRLLSGDWRDPLVTRDAFVGCALGVLVTYIIWLVYAEIDRPIMVISERVLGTRFFISGLLNSLSGGIFYGLGLTSLLFLLRVVLRNQKAAVAVSILIFALMNGPGNFWTFAILLGLGALWFFVLMRFGLVAAALSFFASNLVSAVPTTLDASAWYSGYGYAALAIFAAIVLYAFRASLGGRPLLAPSRLDD
jgi:serine/threonine-protein kinase